MKKTTLLALPIVFLLMLSFAYASCDEVKMDVVEVVKNESCYTFFSVLFEDPGCEYDCFLQVSSFAVIQGGKLIKNESGVFTTFYGVNFHNPDCSAQDVSLIVYDTNGSVLCQKDFLLEEELKQWEAYNTPKEDNDTILTVTYNNDDDAPVGDSKDKTSKSNPPSGGLGSISVEDEIVVNQTSEEASTPSANRPPIFLDDDAKVYVPKEKPEKQEKSFPFYTVLIASLILLSALATGFFVLRKK